MYRLNLFKLSYWLHKMLSGMKSEKSTIWRDYNGIFASKLKVTLLKNFPSATILK